MDYYNQFFSYILDYAIRVARFFYFLPAHVSALTRSSGWTDFKIVLLVVAALASIGILYVVNAMGLIDAKREAMWQRKPAKPAEDPSSLRRREMWQEVVKRLETPFEADWKLAVLEADTILHDLLIDLGYTGDTMADKLKKVAKEKMVSLDFAWNAHRMRNRIAHEGPALSLTRDEAERTLELYRRVFNEFNYVG